MGDPMIWSAIIEAVGSGVGGATAPNPFQPRKSFGGSNDPGTNLNDTRTKINDVFNGISGRIGTPTLPNTDANPIQRPPTFTGGGLPMPIGVQPAPQRLRLTSGNAMPITTGGGGQGPPEHDDDGTIVPGGPGGDQDDSPDDNFPRPGRNPPGGGPWAGPRSLSDGGGGFLDGELMDDGGGGDEGVEDDGLGYGAGGGADFGLGPGGGSGGGGRQQAQGAAQLLLQLANTRGKR